MEYCVHSMNRKCNNISECHDLITITDGDAERVICKICKNQYVLRKDWRGAPEKKLYSKLFKRWTLQGNDNLFYKYNSQYLRT
jgi:hypothetical protein